MTLLPALDGEVIYDDGTVIMRHVRQAVPVDAVIVTFAPYDQNNIAIPGFGETLLHAAGYDLICVQKRTNHAYQSMSRRDFRRAAKPILLRYQRMAFYGSSIGAYAALYYGRDYRADILAFSPRNSLHPIYFEVSGRVRPRRLPFRHEPMLTGDARARRVVTVYDPVRRQQKDWADLRLLEEEIAPAFPQLQQVRLRHTGHVTISALSETRLLRPAILNFFRGGNFDVSPFRRVKGRSPVYLQHLAGWVGEQGRRARAERLVAHGLQLFPGHAGLEQLRAGWRQEEAAAVVPAPEGAPVVAMPEGAPIAAMPEGVLLGPAPRGAAAGPQPEETSPRMQPAEAAAG